MLTAGPDPAADGATPPPVAVVTVGAPVVTGVPYAPEPSAGLVPLPMTPVEPLRLVPVPAVENMPVFELPAAKFPAAIELGTPVLAPVTG